MKISYVNKINYATFSEIALGELFQFNGIINDTNVYMKIAVANISQNLEDHENFAAVSLKTGVTLYVGRSEHVIKLKGQLKLNFNTY